MPEQDVRRITDLFKKIGLPVELSISASKRAKIIQAMRMDKKVSDGTVKFVLAREIGKVEFGIPLSEQDIQSALDKVSKGRKHK